jgi:short-subunit dehydrogenase
VLEKRRLHASKMSDAGQAARRSSQRSWQQPATVLITGANGGIGSALARSYAQPGRLLILHGRDSGLLAALARDCEARGAQVVSTSFDLRDGAVAAAALRQLSGAHTIDLAIINAGVSSMIGGGEEVENWETARAVLAVNLDGAIATIAGVLPAMRRRGAGQIAIMSSLAAYYGLPVTPIYCASKAAMKAYGEALRGWLAPQGVAVNVIMPGFVHTPMSERFRGAKPGLMSPERAATLIRRGLERNRARVVFPRTLAWGMWWLSVLPPALSQRILSALGYGA